MVVEREVRVAVETGVEAMGVAEKEVEKGGGGDGGGDERTGGGVEVMGVGGWGEGRTAVGPAEARRRRGWW